MALAAKYYADQQESFSESELIAAGSEVNIPAELVQRAIQEIEAEKKKAAFVAQVHKKNRQLLLGLAGVLLAATGGWVMVAYNALRATEAKVDAAWAQVDNQMQRRADLLPTHLLIAEAANQPNSALVEVVRGATEDTKTASRAKDRGKPAGGGGSRQLLQLLPPLSPWVGENACRAKPTPV